MITLPFTQMPPTVAGLYLNAAEAGHVFALHVEPRFDGKLVARVPLEATATNLLPVTEYSGLWFGPITDPMLVLDSSTAIPTTQSK